MGGRGFEPPRVAPSAPKADASANFAIRPEIFAQNKSNLSSLKQLRRGDRQDRTRSAARRGARPKAGASASFAIRPL